MPQAPQFRHTQTGKFLLPVVKGGLRNAHLSADFPESDLTHSDLLRGHNQYVGRSLKVNGSVCRDTYKLTTQSYLFLTTSEGWSEVLDSSASAGLK
ncbi:hypothetical protein FFB58_05480 [Enterobacter sp. MF024]|nr:hypothetical protein FFB58_05480 [Enterobacter sp. MF024]